MTPKKKEIPEVPTAIDAAEFVTKPQKAPPPTPEPPKEEMITLRMLESFTDGNLREFFERYGYNVEWPANQVRTIPMWLAKRCASSGAEFERESG